MGLPPSPMKGPRWAEFYTSLLTSFIPNSFVAAYKQTKKQACPHSGVPEAQKFIPASVILGHFCDSLAWPIHYDLT